MGSTLKQCEGDVAAVIKNVVKQHHPEIAKAELKVDALFAFNDEGMAVSLHGYPCLAVVRTVSYKNRVMGRGDAEIVIDGEWWQDAPPPAREALIDHELYHIEVRYDRNNQVKRDRAGRPKIGMRLHDWNLGGFAEVAERHGKHAAEVQQAAEFKKQFGQYVFDFAKKA